MFFKKKLPLAIALATSGSVYAQQSAIEEIVVTATKRAASTQDIPIAVTAVSEKTLEQLGISNFSDYLVQLPGVTAGGSGPGQNTIYIRGVASTTPNLTTAGVAGLAPNVALYLDEQPLAQPGRNLDVYTADMNRVEVLSGPQGTLFGASSQAGTVRLITNKPDPTDTYGNVKVGFATTKLGEESNNIEAMLNLPITEQFTLRGVVYRDDQGGYIDNVAGNLNLTESARFRPQGTVRANGVPVSADRAGFQSTADLSGVQFINADNSALVEEDFNDTTYTGGRLTALVDINDEWSVLLSQSAQQLDSDGVFFADPDLGDLEIARYEQDTMEDSFSNTSLTLTGRFAELEVVYAGAYTDRETEQVIDYADYMFVGQYLPYYICDSSVSYPGSAAPSGVCQAPNLLVDSLTNTKIQTHEIRVSTLSDSKVSATVGAFYSDLELEERNDFTYKGSTQIDGYGAQTGFSPNFPFTTGYISDAGPFPADVIFRNDIRRTDEQFGVFGEVTYEMNDQFALTFGARYYDIEVDFEGSANSSFCNLFQSDSNSFGTDISDIYNGDGQITFRGTCSPDAQITYSAETIDENTPASVVAALNAPDKAKTDGTIFKLTGNWTPSADQLFYATVSEGFRPGLLNRPGGATNPAGTFSVPFALDTDEVLNMEVGWKTDLLDGALRLNGSVFRVDIENLQTTILDPSITNLFFSDNAANAEVTGLETDFIWLPDLAGLTVRGAVSFLDTEITEVLTPTNDVRVGDELAFAPSMQANLLARYEWNLSGDKVAHVMPHMAYSDESYSDIISINRSRIDSWTMFGITAGVSTEKWSAELYIDNLSDERAELSRNFVNDRHRVSYARPRTAGVRLSYNF
ncbi:TonB-dependent receptor [Arenicella xantha]|uniref:Outer membrane receptor protein involved in Fe transport n=1 Tax=Arenicella xantha TaxID=644221 RepID=A0A395JM26_9GAMM|nr:TonB-dependent receptor [Arenicella xantha]RBP50664.1 outer membrane receptor protein involved in Fe transport [Arenicella xantha]